MGLGKTLQMISLILKHKELEAEREKNKSVDKVRLAVKLLQIRFNLIACKIKHIYVSIRAGCRSASS